MATPITLHGIGEVMDIPTMHIMVITVIILTMDITILIGTVIIMVTIPDNIMAVIINRFITVPAVQLPITEHLL